MSRKTIVLLTNENHCMFPVKTHHLCLIGQIIEWRPLSVSAGTSRGLFEEAGRLVGGVGLG